MSASANARILILDGDMVPALTICRSLRRHGCQVYIASHTAKPIAGYSRGKLGVFQYPDPLSAASDFVAWLADHTQRNEYDLVIPVTERTLAPLSRSRARFDHVQVAMPDERSLELVFDKSQTLALAQELGVPIPKGVAVAQLEELDELRDSLHYPVVIKPTRSIGSNDGGASQLQVDYAFNPIGLAAGCTHALRFGPVVLQEYFGGDGVGVELIASEGEILYAFQHRRLHEVPLTGGGSSLRKSEPLNSDLLDASQKLIKALRWSGVAMVEFKLDTTTGAFCLMEINGRFWGSLPLALAAGADFPAMLAELELDGQLAATRPYRNDVYCRLLTRDLWWYEAVLRGDGDVRLVKIPTRAEVLRELHLLLSPRHRFDVQSLTDPLPGLIDLGNIAASYWRRAFSLIGERMFRVQQVRAWRGGAVEKAVAQADSILFLCYGNINRSALADAMIRAYAEDTGVTVYSAGFHAECGRPADPVMIDIAREAGIDLGIQRSRVVSDATLRNSDVIFVMEKSHYDRVLELRPEVKARVFLLGAHAGITQAGAEIDDPYGQSRAAYMRCFDRVSAGVDHIKAILAARAGD